MKITRIKANGFGCLSGEYSLNSDKVNLIVENNELGKSTFVDGILAGLYGFPSERKSKDKMTEFDRLKPWNQDSYEIELEVEVNGKKLLIKRDFLNGKVLINDLLTGKDIGKDYFKNKGYPVGEFLLNISREVFLKTALIRQHEIQSIGGAKSITKRIQEIVDTSSCNSTADEAIEALKSAISNFQGHTLKVSGKIDTEIKRLREKITEIMEKIDALEERRLNVDNEIAEIEKLDREEERLDKDMNLSDCLGKLSEIRELKEEIKEDDLNKEKLEKYSDEMASLKYLSDFPVDKNDILSEMKGRIANIENDIKNEKDELKVLEKEKEEHEKELKRFEEFKEFSENEKKDIDRLFINLRESLKKLKEKRDEIDSEKKKIKGDGYSLNEYDQLKGMFDKVNDDDKDFIGDYEAEESKRDVVLKEKSFELERMEREIDEIIKLRKERKKRGIIISSSGIISIITGLIFLYGMFYMVPFIIVGIIGGIYGFTYYLTANAFQSDRYIDLKNRIETLENEKESLIKERDDNRNKLDNIRKKYGFSNSEDILKRFKYYKKLDGRTGTLNIMNQEYESKEKEVEKIKNDILRYLKKINSNLEISDVTSDYCEEFKNNIEKYFSIYNDIKELVERIEQKKERLGRVFDEKEEAQKEIYNIFKQSGVKETDIDKGVGNYKDKFEKYSRYIKLKDELIPSAERSLMKNQDINVKRARINVREKETGKILKKFTEFKNYKPEKSSTEYYDEFKRKRIVLDDIQNKKSILLESAGRVMNEYRDKYSELDSELSSLKIILYKTECFKRSVELAINVLEKISTESHKNWAAVLNRSVNDILQNTNKNYEDLKFDSDLSFTLKPKGLDRICSQKEIDNQLSSGAKDQIYLSIRFAIGKYFSQSESKLPFILDDPFITSDDERFIEAMSFIISELAKEHQIIILTCHKNRHEQLLRNVDPEWFNENIEICYLT